MATTQGIASWGVKGAVTGVTGIVTDLSVREESVMAPEQNELGATILQTAYDVHKTLSASIIVATNAALPTAGGAIKINNIDCYVTSAEYAESNSSYAKINVSAEAFTNCKTTTAAAAGA